MTKDKLRSEINDLEDKIEELEDLLSDALIDKEHFEQQSSYEETEKKTNVFQPLDEF